MALKYIMTLLWTPLELGMPTAGALYITLRQDVRSTYVADKTQLFITLVYYILYIEGQHNEYPQTKITLGRALHPSGP
jgi:hypothetical protein